MCSDNDCREPDEHHLHMCMVSVKTLTEELAREMCGNPRFTCANCRAGADKEKYLCRPRPL